MHHYFSWVTFHRLRRKQMPSKLCILCIWMWMHQMDHYRRKEIYDRIHYSFSLLSFWAYLTLSKLSTGFTMQVHGLLRLGYKGKANMQVFIFFVHRKVFLIFCAIHINYIISFCFHSWLEHAVRQHMFTRIVQKSPTQMLS